MIRARSRRGDQGVRASEKRAEMEINLDDESGSLLDSLNALREKVTVGELRGIPELSHPVELELLDLLTS